MKQIALACIAMTGFTFGSATEADAGGGIAISVSGRGYAVGYRSGGFGYRNVYGQRFIGRSYGYQPGFRSGYSQWHDTSHWDYTPGYYQPHGNHYHYVPPTYHWHQDGHWDHYGRGHYGH